jgi:plasmid maintenance system antidote protein VapI
MKINKKRIELDLKRLGWSKYRLAQEMNAKHQWVYHVLNNENGLTLKTIERFAEALGADPKDLII